MIQSVADLILVRADTVRISSVLQVSALASQHGASISKNGDSIVLASVSIDIYFMLCI
jgi:hypothetical protein